VGTRPELIRLSLVLRRLQDAGIENHLVHTGQNHDSRLSDIFFEELGLPAPDRHLGIRETSPGRQIAEVIAGTEEVVQAQRPDAMLVLGDTNSGLSAIAAARHGVPIFHMEAGNRCFDWSVPEERNRKVIDHLSDWLLPYTEGARQNLLAEGLPDDRILVSGNPIGDVMEHARPRWEGSGILETLGVSDGEYVLATVHRQECVDVPQRLAVVCAGLEGVARALEVPVIWSVHPRTRERLGEQGRELDPSLRLHEPFGFADFVRLEAGARCVVTDSGTVQEECSLLHVPAVTCRESTERPETVECGSNLLSGIGDADRIVSTVETMLARPADWTSPYEGPVHRGVAERVVEILTRL
jgi:UDP-N-acetylglucosamine 2-epimerase (non-hydrolysing)